MRRPKPNNQFKGTYKAFSITFNIVEGSLEFNQPQIGFNSPNGTLVIETNDDLGYIPNEIIVFNGADHIINRVQDIYKNNLSSLRSNIPIKTIRLTLS